MNNAVIIAAFVLGLILVPLLRGLGYAEPKVPRELENTDRYHA